MRIDTAPFVNALLTWFDAHRRDLPWRRPPTADPASPLDPYHVLVSEAMLQQTQVATVIPYFIRWLNRFPSLTALAQADEQEVLKLWQGLGYYSRARNLHKTAQHIVMYRSGQIPSNLDELRQLPGIGPYTAGAIASIAFDRPVPLVDGNVQRVISRLEGWTDDPRTPTASKRLWARAAELVPATRPGDFNSALMELGATICTPRNPQCLLCPVAHACVARDLQIQNDIPPPKQRVATPQILRVAWCLLRPDNSMLLEQRPPTGRWAGLWQPPSRPPEVNIPLPAEAHVRDVGELAHTLTHRKYLWTIRLVRVPTSFTWPEHDHPTTWAQPGDLARYPLSKPVTRMIDRVLTEMSS